MSAIRIAIVLASALAFTAPATALTIDNFETGPFTLIDDSNDPAATTGEQSGLDTNDVIGGVRLVRVVAGGIAGLTAEALLAPVPMTDNAAILSAQATGTFTFFYDGSANGTPNGVNGTLGLDLSGYEAINISMNVPDGAAPTLQVTLWDSSTVDVGTGVVAINGVTSIDLSEFTGIDLGDVQTIRLSLQGVTVASAISDISASAAPVPEPSTALLLSLGLTGLVARRRLGA